MDNLSRESGGANMPPRTTTIYTILRALGDAEGLIELSLDELAAECGMKRSALSTHLRRLRVAGLLVDLEARGGKAGSWRRLRRVLAPPKPPTQTPFCPTQTPHPNSPFNLKQTGKYASPTLELRSSYREAKRLRRGVLQMPNDSEQTPSSVDRDLDALLNQHTDFREFDLRHLPPYPSPKLYASVQLPEMPRTTGDINSDANMLIQAWRCGVRHFYGKKTRVADRRATFGRMRHVAAIVHAKKIFPHAWTAFRISQIRHAHPDAKTLPKVDMVWSKPTVEKNLEFYNGLRESLTVINKVQLTPAHQELITRWESLRREVMSPKHLPGRVATRAIVASILPEEEYRRLTDKIAVQRRQMEAELYRRAAAGEWIW